MSVTNVRYSIEIELIEQVITLKPNDALDLLVVSATGLDGNTSPIIYLDRDEMEILILKMREMMEHINP